MRIVLDTNTLVSGVTHTITIATAKSRLEDGEEEVS